MLIDTRSEFSVATVGRLRFDTKKMSRIANSLDYLHDDISRIQPENLPSKTALREIIGQVGQVDVSDAESIAGDIQDWQAGITAVLRQLSGHSDFAVSRFATVALRHLNRIHQRHEGHATSTAH